MFHVLIRLALLLAMLNNEGMGGLEINDDSPEIDPVSPAVLGSFLKCGLTEISTLTLTLTLNEVAAKSGKHPGEEDPTQVSKAIACGKSTAKQNGQLFNGRQPEDLIMIRDWYFRELEAMVNEEKGIKATIVQQVYRGFK